MCFKPPLNIGHGVSAKSVNSGSLSPLTFSLTFSPSFSTSSLASPPTATSIPLNSRERMTAITNAFFFILIPRLNDVISIYSYKYLRSTGPPTLLHFHRNTYHLSKIMIWVCFPASYIAKTFRTTGILQLPTRSAEPNHRVRAREDGSGQRSQCGEAAVHNSPKPENFIVTKIIP